MKISGIYQIQSKCKPERIYIGSAVDMSRRWLVHLSDLKKGKHHSKKLQRHYDKYGQFDLVFSIHTGCNKEDLISQEQYFIDAYNPFFNINPKAGSCLGVKRGPHSEERKRQIGLASKGHTAWNKGLKNIFSDEVLKKMIEKKLGVKFSAEHKANISKALVGNKRALGKKFSEETRRRMSLAQMGNKKGLGQIPWNKGMSPSLETRRKIGEGNKGRKSSPEAIRKRAESRKRPILQYDRGMNFIKEWDSSVSAINNLLLSQSKLSSCLNGQRKTTGGFVWKFKAA